MSPKRHLNLFDPHAQFVSNNDALALNPGGTIPLWLADLATPSVSHAPSSNPSDSRNSSLDPQQQQIWNSTPRADSPVRLCELHGLDAAAALLDATEEDENDSAMSGSQSFVFELRASSSQVSST
eukprot:PhM_4_TR8782/c0_g1_i2/m.49494